MGPSGSRRGGAGGAHCSHGAASAGGARGAHGAAAAQDDLWGTGGSVPGGKDRAPQAPWRGMAHWPQPPSQTFHEVPTTPMPRGATSSRCPQLGQNSLCVGVPETGISPRTPVGTTGLQNHPKAVAILMGGCRVPCHNEKTLRRPQNGGCQVPQVLLHAQLHIPSSHPWSRAPQNRSHSPIGDPKCGPRGGSPMGGGPGWGIPGGGRGGGCPPEPGGPGWCCPIPGGPWCTCIGGIPRGMMELGVPGTREAAPGTPRD